jgi:putative transposase
MAKKRRTFSVEQKVQIIQEADQHGITQTLRKHNVSHSGYLRWKHQFDQGGSASLKPQYRKVDPELRALQEENARLKKIIGNQALELEFKTELLKKTRPTSGGSGAREGVCTSECASPKPVKMGWFPAQQLLLQTLRCPQRHQAEYPQSNCPW